MPFVGLLTFNIFKHNTQSIETFLTTNNYIPLNAYASIGWFSSCSSRPHAVFSHNYICKWALVCRHWHWKNSNEIKPLRIDANFKLVLTSLRRIIRPLRTGRQTQRILYWLTYKLCISLEWTSFNLYCKISLSGIKLFTSLKELYPLASQKRGVFLQIRFKSHFIY